MLNFFYPKQLVVPNVVRNLKITGATVLENSLTQTYLHIILECDMEKKKHVIKAQLISVSWFSFTQYTSTCCRCIQNLQTLFPIRADKSVTKI